MRNCRESLVGLTVPAEGNVSGVRAGIIAGRPLRRAP